VGDSIEVPCSGMWELVEDRRGVEFVPAHYLDTLPLTGAEIEDFSLEDRKRRGRWREACTLHLADLRKIYPNGFQKELECLSPSPKTILPP
jgi:hypothetical protein